jgi:hypothetical protein
LIVHWREHPRLKQPENIVIPTTTLEKQNSLQEQDEEITKYPEKVREKRQ